MTASLPQPELMQLALGHTIMGFRPGEHVPGEIARVARAVCEAFDGFAVVDADADEAAREHFLHWGGGYVENEVFLLHAYTYDDACRCGASDMLPPRLLGLGDERLLGAATCCCDEGDAGAVWGVSVPCLPANFVHKRTGYEYAWYKHIRRGTSASHDLSAREVRAIGDDCIASLGDATIRATTEHAWPITAQRRQARATLFEWLDVLPDGVLAGQVSAYDTAMARLGA